MDKTLELTRQLVELPSLTPDDAGCQRLLVKRLLPLGFEVEWFQCGRVSNVLLTHGRGEPSLWFLGHTDVVPPGPVEEWASPPFSATLREGKLYGRGAADMKGAVAAMVTAAEAFVSGQAAHPGQLGILLTSDEEGPADDGVVRVATILQREKRIPQYCLVGEPSSQKQLGDTIRIGRRGSIHGHLQVHGAQGHSAYPQARENPIHRLLPFLHALVTETWDQGTDSFPPTHCQVTNLQAGNGAENVTPGVAEAWFNFRNSPATSAAEIKHRVEKLLLQTGIGDYRLGWRVSGEPFLATAGKLRAAVVDAVQTVLAIEPRASTGGGTSDGRFLAPLGTEVLEFGLLNATIHQLDEWVGKADPDALSQVYEQVMGAILTDCK